jgi:hypothetical protein
MMHRRSYVRLASLTVLAALALAALALAAPALAAPPEAPLTEAPTVTATEATLKGELNPGASTEELSYHFAYNQGTECSNGPVTPEPDGSATGSKQKVSAAASNLVPSAEYTFCLVATNAAQESESSASLSFMTAASAPAVASQSVSSVTPFAANLEAQVNPNNQPTTACHFEYGTLSVSEKVAACSPETLEGFGEQTVSAAVAGLAPGTAYLFRVVVKNATGTVDGPESEFSTLTLEAPIVSSTSTANVFSTDARVQEQVNPNYQEAEYAFEFAASELAVTEGKGTLVPGAPPAALLPAVFEELTAGPVDLGGGLTPRTVYFYRVLATNPSGTTKGPIEQFKTTGAPILTTAEAGSISRTSAVLSGTVDPGGEQTSYHFAYSTDANYRPAEPNPYLKGGVTAQTQLPETDFAAHAAVPAPAIELTPGTTYHYAIVASNAAGSTVGPDVEFTTSPPTPPFASTGAASGVSQTSATLNGSVDTRELSTVAQFEFGTAPEAGSLVPATATPGAGSTETLSASFPGNLQPGTTYWFRTVATNADGTVFGAEVSFTTGVFPGQAAPGAAVLIGWPGFVLRELAEGPPKTGHSSPPPLTKKQKLAKALKACGKKKKSKRTACRRAAKRRFR